MISLNYRDKYNLKLFAVFVIIAEMVHVYINSAPPLYLRSGYVLVYMIFCLSNIKLIPFFTAINLIIERFSISFGEFLPNTLWFHVMILFLGYFLKFRNDGIPIHRACNKYDYISLIFLLTVSIFGFFIHITTITDTGFIASIVLALLLLRCIASYSEENFRLFIFYIVLSATVSIIFSFTHYNDLVSDFYTTSGYVNRLRWKDSNYISFFIGIVSLISLFLYKKNKENVKLFYLISFVVFVVAICLLLSRGTILFLIISLTYYFRKSIFRLSTVKYYILIALLLWVPYQMGFFDSVIERFLSEDFATGSGRINIWRQGIDTFFNKDLFVILFGAGANQASTMAVSGDINWSPHNNYLEILYNYGIFGLIIFVLFFMSLFFTSKTNEKQTMLVYIILSCITIVPFIYVTPIWIILPVIMLYDNKILKYE